MSSFNRPSNMSKTSSKGKPRRKVIGNNTAPKRDQYANIGRVRTQQNRWVNQKHHNNNLNTTPRVVDTPKGPESMRNSSAIVPREPASKQSSDKAPANSKDLSKWTPVKSAPQKPASSSMALCNGESVFAPVSGSELKPRDASAKTFSFTFPSRTDSTNTNRSKVVHQSGRGIIPKTPPRFVVKPFRPQNNDYQIVRLQNRMLGEMDKNFWGYVEKFQRPEENMKADKLKKGDIISLVTHARHRGAFVYNDNEAVSYAGPYGAAFSKYRKMIVTECYAQHLNCVPIFTYGNTGGENRGIEDEIIHIRNRSEENSEEVSKLGDNVIFADQYDDFHGPFVRAPCVLQVSEQHRVEYGEKVCLEGSISLLDVVRISNAKIDAISRNNEAALDEITMALKPSKMKLEFLEDERKYR